MFDKIIAFEVPAYIVIPILILFLIIYFSLKERYYLNKIKKSLGGINGKFDLILYIFENTDIFWSQIYKGLEFSYGELKGIKLNTIKIKNDKKKSIDFYNKLIELKNNGFLKAKIKIKINGRSSNFLNFETIKAEIIEFGGNIINLGKIKLIECQDFKLKGKYDFLQCDIINKINNGLLKIFFLEKDKKINFKIDFIESKIFDLENIPGNLKINFGKKVNPKILDKINNIKIKKINGTLIIKGAKEYSNLFKEKIDKGSIVVENFIIK